MNLNTVDELRGAYNRFVRSDAGKDFLGKLLAYEISLTAQAMNESEHQKKAQFIDKASGIYWVRTLIDELSKPSKPVSRASSSLKRPR